MRRPGGIEWVHDVCNRYPPEVVALCDVLFYGDLRRMGALLFEMVAEPLVFGTQQRAFHAALVAAGGIEESAIGGDGVPVVHYVSDDYARHGIVAVQLAPLLTALCRVLLHDAAAPATDSITAVPCRVMSALLFWGGDAAYPLRNWTIRRFLEPGCDHARQWGALAGEPERRLLQTPEFLDMVYFESAMCSADPRLLDERARIEMRAAMCEQPMAALWTSAATMQRVMEQTAPRVLLTFYSYFLHRMYAANVADAQRYWELAFAMLVDLRADMFMPIVSALTPATLALIADVAEQMRAFLRAPQLGAAPPSLVQSLYARTSDFHKTFLPNRDVRSMILDRATARRFMELFYVPVAEGALSDLVTGLCAGPQVGQLHALMVWLTQTTTEWSLAYALDISDAGAERRAALNEAMYVCTMPPGTRVHRVHWTLEHMERAHPQLFAGLTQRAYVGLNQHNHPFLVLPRPTMDALRITMLADALTMGTYRKTTAIYPLLMRLYLTQRPDAALDDISLLAFAHIVGYWLCIGETGDNTFVREGMPMYGESVTYVGVLHRLVALLGADTLSLETLNAVRSYFMMKAPHRITPLLHRVAARIAPDDAEWAWLREALDVAAAVATTADVRRPGRPRADAARQPPTTLVTAHPHYGAALAARNPLNVLCERPPSARMPLVNLGTYAYAMTRLPADEARALLLEFVVDAAPLCERDYRRPRYNVPADFAVPWQQSNDFFASTAGTRYCRADQTLRPEFVNADFAPLVRFLQQLELFVCASDIARHTGTPGTTATVPGADAALLRELTAVYRDPQRVLNTMPVASYFNAHTGRYYLTEWESSLAIADALPAALGGASANPASRAVCGDTTTNSQLSDVAIDIVAMFGNAFDEERAVDPAAVNSFYQRALAGRDGSACVRSVK